MLTKKKKKRRRRKLSSRGSPKRKVIFLQHSCVVKPKKRRTDGQCTIAMVSNLGRFISFRCVVVSCRADQHDSTDLQLRCGECRCKSCVSCAAFFIHLNNRLCVVWPTPWVVRQLHNKRSLQRIHHGECCDRSLSWSPSVLGAGNKRGVQ